MRELYFRGQTRKYGEKIRNYRGDPMESNWVYGSGIFFKNNDHAGDYSIIYTYDPKVDKYVVYTETVGQYVGKRDCAGTRIFDGDIVLLDGEFLKIVWQETQVVAIREDGTIMPWDNVVKGNVVGNVHDKAQLELFHKKHSNLDPRTEYLVKPKEE